MAAAEIYTLSLHDALPISQENVFGPANLANHQQYWEARADRKITRLNSSHERISYAGRVWGTSGKNAIINQRCMSVESVATDQSPSDPVIGKASCAFDTASTAGPDPA